MVKTTLLELGSEGIPEEIVDLPLPHIMVAIVDVVFSIMNASNNPPLIFFIPQILEPNFEVGKVTL